jgi:hypothetical protein
MTSMMLRLGILYKIIMHSYKKAERSACQTLIVQFQLYLMAPLICDLQNLKGHEERLLEQILVSTKLLRLKSKLSRQ